MPTCVSRAGSRARCRMWNVPVDGVLSTTSPVGGPVVICYLLAPGGPVVFIQTLNWCCASSAFNWAVASCLCICWLQFCWSHCIGILHLNHVYTSVCNVCMFWRCDVFVVAVMDAVVLPQHWCIPPWLMMEHGYVWLMAQGHFLCRQNV